MWVHDVTVPIRDASGEIICYQGVLCDITEPKRAEQELAQALDMERTAVERLREADDMKNTFLTAVSHDLRTPLSAILGSAITPSADDLQLSDEDRRQLIRSLARKAKRLTAMVNDLLDIDTPHARTRAAPPGAHRPRRGARSDRRRVGRAGRAHRPRPGGTDRCVITSRWSSDRREPARERREAHAADGDDLVGATRVDHGVIIRVEDDGPGVADDERERLFEPFERGEGSEPSPGLDGVSRS